MSAHQSRVAVVFGSENLVGAAVVAQLRRDGATVLSPGLPERDESAWSAAFGDLRTKHGRIDIIINAAHRIAPTPIAATLVADYMDIFDGLAENAWLFQKYAVLALRAAGGGKVVVLTSVLGRVGAPSASAVCAASRGILMSTKSAALECARAKDAITINAVLVGRIEGDPAHWPDGALLPQAPIVTPTQVAEAVAFLAAEGSEYMTGVDVQVDGGFIAA